ncbi:MAG: YIP1 family protein [Halobacteriaceae archaeon]
MTQWVERAEGGRARGPRGLLRAWAEVLVRPRRFFRAGVAPGDQAPGLAFAMAVALVAAATRFALVPSSRAPVSGSPFVDYALSVAGVTLFLAPVVVHLVAALQTAVLAVAAPDRGGVGETVQVVAYAAAPCAFAGVPSPGLQVLCAGYGTALLAVGLSERHRLGVGRALLASLPAAAVVFGYGFGGFGAVSALFGGG